MTNEFEAVSFEGILVKCGSCGGCFHSLTRHFEPVPPMKGHYLRMLPRYRGNGWYAFPERDWVVGDNVQCPQCGMPYKMESILRQVRRHVDSLSAGQDSGLEVQAQGEAPTQADAAGAVAAQSVSGPAAVPAATPAGGDDPDPDDLGIYDHSLAGDDILSKVMRMTSEGYSQTRIAETCQISVYMVRQIQNGKKV